MSEASKSGIKAHSAKPDGIRLMRHIGFTEVVASIPGMHDFMIDVEESGIPFFNGVQGGTERMESKPLNNET